MDKNKCPKWTYEKRMAEKICKKTSLEHNALISKFL